MLTKCGIGSNTALGSGGRNRKREVREALGGGYSVGSNIGYAIRGSSVSHPLIDDPRIETDVSADGCEWISDGYG